MKQKNIDQYFESARQLPLAMSFEEVQALVKIKGITATGKNTSWWNLKNFIFMTTAAIIITSTLLIVPFNKKEVETFSSTEKVKTNQIKHQPQKQQVKEHTYQPVNEENPIEEEVHPYSTSIKTVNAKSAFNLMPKEDGLTPIVELSSLNPVQEYTLQKRDTSEKRADDYTKVITKEMPVNGAKWVKTFLSNGDIKVNTWEESTVKLEAFILIEANNEEDKQQLINDLKVDLLKKGDKIEVVSECENDKDCICDCSSTVIKGGKKNKKVKKNAKKVQIDYQLTVPKNMNLDLKNDYGNIELESINGEVIINSFQGGFYAQKIGGKLNLTSKYGKGEVASFSSGNIELFQSKMYLGSSDKMDLSAKYSKVNIDKVNELKLEAFQSNVDVKSDVKQIEGSLKYGDLNLTQNAKNVDLVVFQAKLNTQSMDKVELDGSYSSINATEINELTLINSFQNKLNLAKLHLVKGSAKYSNFNIQLLTSQLDLELFQGSMNIDQIDAGFENLSFNSKYTPIDLNFDEQSNYQLDIQTTYTSVNYPEQKMKLEYENKELNHFDLKGVYGNGASSTVKLVSFQGKINIK